MIAAAGPVGARVYLRWGATTRAGSPANPVINWRGWGYRKIFAKHGWSLDDQVATLEALNDPDPDYEEKEQEGEPIQVWTYHGPHYLGLGNVDCYRTVVVEYEPRNDEIAAGVPSAGIVSSYGRLYP